MNAVSVSQPFPDDEGMAEEQKQRRATDGEEGRRYFSFGEAIYFLQECKMIKRVFSNQIIHPSCSCHH
jgi:hypothetical protein